ncbi:MAG: 30S ribosomal protein S6 [Desulfotignum sp.]|nr:30S ribosomal protein S6 [Desulfotignum sp.]MCF8126124.1 30S ribosomal protein S6 [Desulfotignum sp.]
MRKYETVIISDPDLQDQARTELFDKIRNVITREDGIFLYLDDWGNKKLAYEINKKLRGHYTCLTYGGTGGLVKELERNLGLNDDVMKFMTILLSTDVTAQSLAQEAKDIEDAKTASEAAAANVDDGEETEKDTGQEQAAPEAETAEPEPAEPVTSVQN